MLNSFSHRLLVCAGAVHIYDNVVDKKPTIYCASPTFVGYTIVLYFFLILSHVESESVKRAKRVYVQCT